MRTKLRPAQKAYHGGIEEQGVNFRENWGLGKFHIIRSSMDWLLGRKILKN